MKETIVDLLYRRANELGDETVYTFLADGEDQEVPLTYLRLHEEAQAIAAFLGSMRAAGETVLLIYPPGLKYIGAFFGCLYAGAVAVPCYPPDPLRVMRTMSRLGKILEDSRARVALTTRELRSALTSLSPEAFDGAKLRWCVTDDITGGIRSLPVIREEAVAFIQYTSGSTANPKGVIVSHGNLMHNLESIAGYLGKTAASRGVTWLPFYHDMGLIDGVLSPVYSGYPTVLMSPSAFLEKPLRWLKAITKYSATTSGAPNFAYDLCVRKIGPDQRRQLDLRSWQHAYNGAEPVRTDTIERFCEAFSACGFERQNFYPCYGLAEATLAVSGAEGPSAVSFKRRDLESNLAREAGKNDSDVSVLVSSGNVLGGQKVVIADPDSFARCASGRIGEIWLKGPSVAQGYWHRPAETKEIFQAFLRDTGEGPFLRTGDLGFFCGRDLFITGRLKDLIIIRGKNYYPQDLELTAEKADIGLRPGCLAAFSVDVAGEERLALAGEIETTRELQIYAIFSSLRRAVFEEHGIAVHAISLLKPKTIPKTTSGKIQRNLCRRQFQEKKLALVAQWNETQGMVPENTSQLLEDIRQWLVAHISQKQPNPVDVDRPLTEYFLDSLRWAELKETIESTFAVTLHWEIFLDSDATIADLAGAIMQSMVKTV